MNKQWYSAAELVGLAGLPSSDRRIRSRAEKDGWVSRKREKGKGLEYHFDSLPEAAQRDLANRQAAEQAASPIARQATAVAALSGSQKAVDTGAQINGIKQLVTLPQVARQRADAKLLILNAANEFLTPYRRSKQLVAGEHAFSIAYKERTLQLPEWVYQAVKSVSWNSPRRWQEILDKEGAAALAGRYKTDSRNKIDAQLNMGPFLQAVIIAKPHLASKAAKLRELLEIHSAKNELDWDIPSIGAIRRWVIGWSSANQAAIAYVTDPNLYNSKYRTAVERPYPWMTMPNDVWEFDSTPVDAMLKEGRHAIIAVIDVFTRRVKLLVSPTSDSQGICLLLRKTLLDWGTLNETGIAKTDNGSDYVSQRTTAVFNLIGITHERAKPYSGWEKPFIERFFRTLSHGIVELLPGYIGHSVADREVIESARHFAQRLAEKRKPEHEKEGFELRLTRDQLQEFLDNWIDAYYHHRPHQGDGMNGKTPFQKYAESGYQPRAVMDEGALDILLNHIGEATVLKGVVKCDTLRYSAPELLEHSWKGQRVSIFQDPSDVGRAFIYRLGEWGNRVEAIDTRLIGQGISPDAFRAKKKEDDRALRSFRREMNQLVKTFDVDHLHQDAIEHFTETAKGLALFPQPAREHTNEAIAALSKTADRLRQPNDPQYSDAEIEHLSRQREAIQAKQEAMEQQKGLLIRNEHDKAVWLAEQSLTRELNEKEQRYLESYKRENRLGRRRIEEIMARQSKSG